MAVWIASMTGTKTLLWQWVITQSKGGQQEVTDVDPLSARTADIRERYFWQVKPFGNPGRKAKPMRCRENEQRCYRGASPLATSLGNGLPALRTNSQFALSSSSLTRAPDLPVLQCLLSLSTYCSLSPNWQLNSQPW